MTAYPRPHSTLGGPVPKIDWHRVFRVLLAMAFVAAILCLATLGLDALNDPLARGFASLGNPSG